MVSKVGVRGKCRGLCIEMKVIDEGDFTSQWWYAQNSIQGVYKTYTVH